ncbi:uncharacterized protein LOC120350804 [Nilaparvata lugens]|uniref:uncharacterized protein LOC120350804 n=1 Tax=Nilaparvata lugens TaxID=108931 RepID=UPI00193DF47F|nr:uncharacterized protein LOC120350804 [Nilaparvata lugens]
MFHENVFNLDYDSPMFWFLGSVLPRMSSVEDVILAAAACVVLSKQRRPRRYWVRPSLNSRATYSGNDLLDDLNRDDVDPLSGELRTDGSFKNFVRMTSEDFEYITLMIGHKISKMDTNYRKAISVTEKLAVTLRFLATGDSYTSLSYLFKISKSTISLFVPEVCEALIDLLKDNIKVRRYK